MPSAKVLASKHIKELIKVLHKPVTPDRQEKIADIFVRSAQDGPESEAEFLLRIDNLVNHFTTELVNDNGTVIKVKLKKSPIAYSEELKEAMDKWHQHKATITQTNAKMSKLANETAQEVVKIFQEIGAGWTQTLAHIMHMRNQPQAEFTRALAHVIHFHH